MATTDLPTVVQMESEAVVLVVSWLPSDLSLFKAILSAHNFDMLTAEKGVEAVTFYQERREEIDLVILNRSPDGQKTFEALRTIDPAVRIAFMSGLFLPDLIEWEEQMMIRGVVGRIIKPFRLEEVVMSIREWCLR